MSSPAGLNIRTRTGNILVDCAQTSQRRSRDHKVVASLGNGDKAGRPEEVKTHDTTRLTDAWARRHCCGALAS